jgi:flagellar biosynthesis chaperone FliJ
MDTSDSVKNLTTSMNEVAEIGAKYDQTAEQIDSVSQATKEYADRLQELEQQGLDTAEAQAEYKQIVDRLNTLIPDLNLTINEQTGLINASTSAIYDNVEAWKAAAMTEALKTKYQEFGVTLDELNDKIAANDELLTQANDDQAAALEELAPIYEVLADRLGMTVDEVAVLARSQGTLTAAALEAGADVGDYADQVWNHIGAYEDATSRLDKNTSVEEKNAATKTELQQQMAALEDKVADFLDGVDALTDSTPKNTAATKKATSAYDSHETAATNLKNKTDLLNEAIAEQIENNGLTKETYDKLTAAGYANLIQKDEETGALYVNKDAYEKLTAAQYDELIAQMKLEQSDIETKLQAVTKALQDAATAGVEMSMGYYYAAQAQSALE